MPVKAMVLDGLHLELHFSFHHFRWGTREVLPSLRRVTEGGEQRGMEHVMNSPRRGKGQLVSNGGDLFDD